MSNVYQPKRKELAKVQVVSTETCFENRSKYCLIQKKGHHRVPFFWCGKSGEPIQQSPNRQGKISKTKFS